MVATPQSPSSGLSLAGWWAAPSWLRQTVAIALALAVVIFLARQSKFADRWITAALLLVVLYLVLHNWEFVAIWLNQLASSIAGAAQPHA